MFSLIFRILNRNTVKLFVKCPAKPYCLTSSVVRLKSQDVFGIEDDEKENQEYGELLSQYFQYGSDHSCFIIHPYVKWGPHKIKDTSPDLQLEEAISLIRTLESWKVRGSTIVPLENLERKTLFGSGTLAKLKGNVRGDPSITAVFLNTMLRNIQKEKLEQIFGVPIFDRYNIVMLILKMHAISKHAKLQVALAEVGYLLARLKKGDDNTGTIFETKKLMLHTREQKIKKAITKLRAQREHQRTNRKKIDFPVVAVVGYTNTGKTSLIKSLTQDKSLVPQDKLFATLDVTLHAGVLPSSLQVLYVDTVGFISDIPTTLIECFVVTLEDALFADVIVHVENLSSKSLLHQRNHVLNTLSNLASKIDEGGLLEKIITVGNKCDKIADGDCMSEGLKVSAKTGYGIDKLLDKIEEKVLSSTGREIITVKVPIGGDEIRWLYKNATIVQTEEDATNSEYQKTKIIITPAKLHQFKHRFI